MAASTHSYTHAYLPTRMCIVTYTPCGRYPLGSSICVTKGVVSRIDLKPYNTPAMDGLLMIQVTHVRTRVLGGDISCGDRSMLPSIPATAAGLHLTDTARCRRPHAHTCGMCRVSDVHCLLLWHRW